MELRLTLTRIHGEFLPINYQYELSAWVYKVIHQADETYSTFLHEKGYTFQGRNFKLFTFSQLDLRPYTPQGELIKLLGRALTLHVRFLIDESLTHFITGLFMNQCFRLGNKQAQIDLEVSSIETLPPPLFTSTQRYQCLSPVCISKPRKDGTAEYLSPEHPEYGTCLVKNLLHKQKSLAMTVPEEAELSIPFNFRLLNTPRKKGVHIKSHTNQHTQVIGYLFHFELTASIELHEIGYNAGFGEKNSMGFGCVQCLNRD